MGFEDYYYYDNFGEFYHESDYERPEDVDGGRDAYWDDLHPDEFQENNDFAHDDDWDNYIAEDQHLDGMYEE